MDPFEVRLQFTSLLSRLTSSLASIQKVSSFALKHGPRCGDDIWDCLVDECSHLNLNARINLLYFLDSLLDKELPTESSSKQPQQQQPYKGLVKRDLAKVVDMVVPHTREGVLNLMSANQVLRSWRTRRLLDTDILDAILADLEGRRESLHSAEADTTAFSTFSRNDILRRIEDDRERHKRLRERIWVLPVPSSLTTAPSPSLLASTSSSAPPPPASSSAKPSPISPASPSEFGPTSKGKSRAKQALAKGPTPSKAASSSNSKTSAAAAAAMPPPPVPGSSSSSSTAANSQTYPPARGPELALEIEFEQLWEASEEEMRRALWIGEDGVELDEDPEGEEVEAILPSFQPSPNPPQASKLAPPPPPPPPPVPDEDDEMEEGEEREEGEVLDDNPPPPLGMEGREEGEEENDPRASKRVKREKGKRNSRGGWALDESEKAAMRRERERCFGVEDR
ncbi:CTD kinase subunit gamma CTK3-domain-containing protein [Leucosporidium creatinivorum]|uniref:CTD kinase subunit gamma CTK3-domain-containing protein n=1 Tax=Leucosporidium creatinivorum TaxID=106004 RepID=A0A1Y2ECK0_9BASI|nr:CTD kinase subunit gamma CTK3-domain-containing protein [Leucosporidium creatinivorum]